MSKKTTSAPATKTAKKAKPAPATKTAKKAAPVAAEKPTKKAAAKAPQPVAAPVAAPLRTIDRAEFESIVRAEAHALALARELRNGSPFSDWLRAEAAVLARLTAEGISLAPSANDSTRA